MYNRYSVLYLVYTNDDVFEFLTSSKIVYFFNILTNWEQIVFFLNKNNNDIHNFIFTFLEFLLKRENYNAYLIRAYYNGNLIFNY